VTTFYRLLSEHGTAEAALAALPDVARAAGVSDYSICPEGVVQSELRAGRRAGARLVFRGDAEYPRPLADLPDAPPMFWALGDTGLLSRPMVAMVGARNASSLGLRMAQRLASDLASAGLVVVSGLARGIDAAAHTAALSGGTIAVQAGGVDILYPRENADLAHDIAARGLRISEQPMGLQPQARHFPIRNRIIAGLAQSVVIVEAALRSGSLITADAALALGRDVLAVPGHPFDARAGGCNALIRDGATLVRSAADILESVSTTSVEPAIAPQPVEPPAQKRSLRDTAVLHAQILERLGPSPLAEDQLIRDLGAPVAEIAPAIVDLEIDGHINRQAGGLISRVVN